ncbi:MAG: NAD-dependent epimerase/dehydratase family protein [Defluviitaleaceae bacterium]|nr:NAD-dependent epimerase/dehydratase family protein [Defluviitaleaceae bacterium]
MNKNVLIVGQGSYIGERFARYAADRYNIVTVNARDNHWQEADFTDVDTVLHVAGIVHVKQRKDMKPLYYRVNCDLALEVAKKAKASGVGLFIFLSSMAVHRPNPKDYYGGSKMKAEQGLQELSSPDFRVCIVRPPMVYGPGCKGNFPKLVKLAERTPIFPDVNNRRSAIYIDNLCEFLCLAIQKNLDGIHSPQNAEYINTTRLTLFIASLRGKKIRTTRFFNPLILPLMKCVPSLYKLFGTLTCDPSGDEAEYNVMEYEESVRVSVCTDI